MPRPRRTLARAALLAVAAVAASLPAATAAHAAGTTTINFDDVAVGTQLSDEYAGQGVRFGDYQDFGFPIPGDVAQTCGGGRIVASAINGRSDNFACKANRENAPGGANLMIEFEDPRKRVAFNLKSVLASTYPLHLRFYNLSHQLVRSIDDTLPPSQVKAVSLADLPSASIAYAEIKVDVTSIGQYDAVYLDDLSAPLEDGRTPAYSLAVQEPSVTTYEQSTVDVPLSVRRFGGSVGAVPFTPAAPPAGVTGIQFTPPSVTGRETAKMRVSVGGPLNGDRQVAVSVPSNVGGSAGTGAITAGVANVHVEPALTAEEGTQPRVYVPGCADPDPTYFTVRGDFTGDITVRPLSGSTTLGQGAPIVTSGDAKFVRVTHSGSYSFSYPWGEKIPGQGGTNIQTWELSGSGLTTVTFKQRFDEVPVRVTGVSVASMPETQTQLKVRGSFPGACKLKFVDGLGQEWKILDRAYEDGTDVITLERPGPWPAVTVPNGFSVQNAAGAELARTPPVDVRSFRNTAAVRQANSGPGAGTMSYSWDDFVATWGRDDAYNCAIVCSRDGDAEKFYEAQKAELAKNGGLCFGYALVALLFNGYNDNVLRPDLFEPGARRGYDIRNFADGTAIKKAIVSYYESQYDYDYAIKTSRPYAGPPTMAARLVEQRTLLARLLARNGGALVHFYSGTSGHAVAAYRMTNNADGGFTIDIADPNVPYTASEETVLGDHSGNLMTSQIIVKGDGTWSGSSTGWSGDLTTLQVTDAWKQGTLRLPSNAWQVDAAHGDIAAIQTGGKPTLNPDRTPLKDGPVTMFSPATGNTAFPRYTLAKGRSYDVAVTADGDGTLLTSLGLGAGVVVESPQAKAGQVDHVTMTPGRPQVRYAAGGDASGVKLSLIDDQGKNAERTADITLSTRKGATDTASLADGGLSIAHQGGGTAKVTVGLGATGAGLPTGASLAPLSIGSGQTLRLAPGSWSQLGGGVRYAVKDAKGRTVRAGRARLRAERTVGLGAIAAVAKGKTVTITGRVTKRGGAPLLAASAETLGAGGKVKARKGASLEGATVRNGRFTLKVKVPAVKRGARVRVTVTLVDQAAGLEAGVATKAKTVRAR